MLNAFDIFYQTQNAEGVITHDYKLVIADTVENAIKKLRTRLKTGEEITLIDKIEHTTSHVIC